MPHCASLASIQFAAHAFAQHLFTRLDPSPVIERFRPGPPRDRSLRETARGFTLVELLVVIAIIGVLVSLLLPAIQSAREAARRVQCQNNIRQIGVAVINYEAANQGLPAFSELVTFPPNTPTGQLRTDLPGAMKFSWIVRILPYLEEQQLYDQFNFNVPADEQVNLAGEPVNPQAVTVSALLCPSDGAENRFFQHPFHTKDRLFAKGNYAAYVSPVHVECLRIYPGAIGERETRLAKVRDGTSKTIVAAEVRTRNHLQDERGAWALAYTGSTMLAFDMHDATSCFQGCGNTAVVRKSRRFSPCVDSVMPDDKTQAPNNISSAWNRDMLAVCPEPSKAAIEGLPCRTWAYQSAASRSRHPGGVNVVFLDGSVLFITDEIDRFLMARYISINDGQGVVEGMVAR